MSTSDPDNYCRIHDLFDCPYAHDIRSLTVGPPPKDGDEADYTSSMRFDSLGLLREEA